VLLSPPDCVAFCQQPAAALDLAAGRLLEARHQLHLDGEPARLRAFLELSKPDMLASPDVFNTLLKVMKPATKPLYAGLTNILGKVFTAAGASYYYDFSDAALADDFQDYLNDATRAGQDFYGQFRTVWSKACLTGFQGVLLVDLAAPVTGNIGEVDDVPLALPEPAFSFVPSSRIQDVAVTGNRLEYLILSAPGPEKQPQYYCWDDLYCHRVQRVAGELTLVPALQTTHGLGYVPACPVTTRQPDPTRPVRRTSAVAESLELADVYLRDFNEHELGKTYHAFPKMWSYGVRCDYQPPIVPGADGYQFAQSCNAGRLFLGDGVGTYSCPRCAGSGRYIPVGPDKTFIVEVPTDSSQPSIIPPAGYIVPDLTSLTYLGDELGKNAGLIEKAVIGKEGITRVSTKVESGAAKFLDMAPVYDALNDHGDDATVAMRFVVDAMGRLRYGEAYRSSALSLGKRYQLRSVEQLEEQYQAAKAAGIDSALLYGYLEELVYTKYHNDPLELQRGLLKLELTPVPHLTDQEAQALGIIGDDDLLLKAYLNDFVQRFERENGSILEFGEVLPYGLKVQKILDIFTSYLDGKRKAKPAPFIPGTLQPNPAAVPAAAGPDGAAPVPAQPQPQPQPGAGATGRN
jgi:hypothetical protein